MFPPFTSVPQVRCPVRRAGMAICDRDVPLVLRRGCRRGAFRLATNATACRGGSGMGASGPAHDGLQTPGPGSGTAATPGGAGGVRREPRILSRYPRHQFLTAIVQGG